MQGTRSIQSFYQLTINRIINGTDDLQNQPAIEEAKHDFPQWNFKWTMRVWVLSFSGFLRGHQSDQKQKHNIPAACRK